ncbi:hypothetical protein RB195_016316 [Necator americanus]|uniref:HAD hydrolase, family IIA n=1 Tax=Necator americanus TaxID=51031 RepID=A0ABR1E955_NECAM
MAEKSEFQKRMMEIGVKGILSASISLGHSLGLFQALAKVGSEEHPATAAEVAAESGCKERYVKEWLSVMAVGDVISVTEDEKFFIKKENVEHLLGGVAVQFNTFLPVFMRGYDRIGDVFKKEGPLGLKYSDFADFYNTMAQFSEAIHKKHLISDFIPALGSDMKERLTNGGMMCLDVGCGKGFHAALLAENFPKSNFMGIDITLEAIHLANQQRKDNGQTFDNLAFIQMSAAKMDDDWTDKFDIVTIFDACHDQMRPDLCLKEIHRVLKPGGVFGMLEVDGTSNVFKDKQEKGLMAVQMYGCSMFHCLPVGSNSEDALGLGAMWGKERAVKMLKDAGFANVSVLPTPQFVINVLIPEKSEISNMKRCVALIDLNGTLHIEDMAIPRAAEALDRLRKIRPVKFVTNTTKESINVLHNRVTGCGFRISKDEIFTSLVAARNFVEQRNLRPMLMLAKEALEDFEGITTSNPNAVVIGLAPSEFHFEKLNDAFKLVLNGAELVAVHKGRYYKRGDGLALGPGPFVAAIEYATGAKATVVGKPESAFFHMGASTLGNDIDLANSVMIGDDAKDDVLGAINCGMKGILVRTGKYRKGDELQIPQERRNCVESFAEAVDMIESGEVL